MHSFTILWRVVCANNVLFTILWRGVCANNVLFTTLWRVVCANNVLFTILWRGVFANNVLFTILWLCWGRLKQRFPYLKPARLEHAAEPRRGVTARRTEPGNRAHAFRMTLVVQGNKLPQIMTPSR